MKGAIHHRGTETTEEAQRILFNSLCYLRGLCASVVKLKPQHIQFQSRLISDRLFDDQFGLAQILFEIASMLVDLALVPVDSVNRIATRRQLETFSRGEQPRLPLYEQIKLVDEIRIHSLFVALVNDEADEVYFNGLRKLEQEY